jgi:hypothetical protein
VSGCPSPELRPFLRPLILAGHAGHDGRVLKTVLLIAEALTLIWANALSSGFSGTGFCD